MLRQDIKTSWQAMTIYFSTPHPDPLPQGERESLGIFLNTVAFLKTIFRKRKPYPFALSLSKGDFPFMVRQAHHERPCHAIECGYEIKKNALVFPPSLEGRVISTDNFKYHQPLT
jgi:hypothetical protein